MRRIHRFRRTVARDSGLQELLDELGAMRATLDDAYRRFNAATESELIDACVYEINAAQSRYNYLLRMVKERGGEAAFQTYSGEEGVAWA